jgi:hypothetical protein
MRGETWLQPGIPAAKGGRRMVVQRGEIGDLMTDRLANLK